MIVEYVEHGDAHGISYPEKIFVKKFAHVAWDFGKQKSFLILDNLSIRSFAPMGG
jgi:hypothetical protein